MAESRREEAEHSLREFSSQDYKIDYRIVDPWQSSYQPGSDSPDVEKCHGQTQLELYPGDKIRDARQQGCVLFSGSIISREQGLTVAHAIGRGTSPEIEIVCKSDNTARIIGTGRAGPFRNLQRQDGRLLTADLALLKLNTTRCTVGNTVWWPFRGADTAYRIKICKNEMIPDHTRVIILDQNGEFQNGCIHNDRFSDETIEGYDEGLHDVIAIRASEIQEVSVTQPGDSGALVMSIPNRGDDVLQVYGIAIGICTKPDGKSLTIANSLWKVIREISTNENYSAELGVHVVDGVPHIDFA